MLEEKIRWIDCAKGVGILLVVYGHVARGLVNADLMAADAWFQAVDSIVYSFHMPLFFIISGVLFEKSFFRHGWRLVFNRAASLLYPFVVWSIFQGAVEVSISQYKNFPVLWSEVAWSLIFPRQHFWYLYALFFLNLTAVLLMVFKPSGKTMAAFLALSALAVVYGPVSQSCPPLKYVCGYFFYFFFGVVLSRRPDAISEVSRYGLLVLAASIALQGWGISGVVVSESGRAWAALLVALVCSQAVFIFSFLSRGRLAKCLAFLGLNSLYIYLMHVVFASGFRIVLAKVLGVNTAWLHLFMGCVIGVGVPCVIRALLKERIDFLFDFRRWSLR
ncbi:acyltransferase family protein [Uliginosibacterium aquaticum]|uniref:Acyltransferase n=1 Tax=Uliginosibacterium aquaticum TaxID=2731212 RepID=A0ABX2II42_9RHOO|nr:acyltransferase [Uliginosibacterium aquaticum]NSL54038.1 acyltransferase [Uliginosibacterium aquaticum]